MVKQLLQAYKSGEIRLVEVPTPVVRPGGVLVRTRASLISAGTELLLLRESQTSMLERIRRRPEAVKRILKTALTQGFRSTWERVQDKLGDLISMGYSCAGEVIAVGESVTEFRVAQRVACAGVGYACHSEVNFVPRNLCVPMPDGVDFDEAAFVALGAIAAQGVRQAQVQFGDVVGVVGLGLIGQITVQLLRAAGCRVVGSDIVEDKCRKAREYGVQAVPPAEFARTVLAASDDHGADAVIITASSPSSEILVNAAEVARMRAKLVIVGAVGMDLPRGPFYTKELDIRFSMSYGPGRYDPAYEEHGHDYPYDLVRWTEQRNMAAVLGLCAARSLDLKGLITHRYPLDGAHEAYALMDSGKENYLGMVIAYDRPDEQVLAEKRVVLTQAAKPAKTGGDVRVGLIGAGEFARGTLLPAIRSHPHVRLVGVAEVTSKTGLLAGQRSGFEYCTCDYREILRDANIDAVFVATRHHVHAAQVCEALAAGKHVFVEKPLGLTLDELEKVRDALAASGGWLVLQVGHNRRFSAAADELRAFFRDRKSPMVLNYRVNAGPMPATHWTRGPEGGGRWLGEGSHFVDFAVAICGAVPDRLYATRIRTGRDSSVGETWNVTLTFPDSSTATISYCDLGNSGVPKERCEVFADGKIAILDDYTQLNLYERGSKRTVKLTDKGHPAEVAAFIDAVRGARPLPVSVDEELAVASITILCARSAETGEAVAFDLAAALADV